MTHQPEIHKRGFCDAPLAFKVNNLHINENGDFKNEEDAHEGASAEFALEASQVEHSLDCVDDVHAEDQPEGQLQVRDRAVVLGVVNDEESAHC